MDAIDEMIDYVGQNERNRITLWLMDSNPDIAAVSELPTWRGVIFALLHPRRFAVAVTLAKAASAIHKGEHAKR